MESPNSSYYLLRWSDHISNYAEMFLTLREQDEFIDCSIACEDGMIGAHRLVLAGCSPYMRDLFKRANNPHPIIFLLDVSRSTVLLLLEFIYRGQAHIPHSRLRQLVTLGKALKIKGISQVFMPNRYETVEHQIPRLHGCPDPVSEINDLAERMNGDTHLNGGSRGSFLATPLPSEKDFPTRGNSQRDMNGKGSSDTAQKDNLHMSKKRGYEDTVADANMSEGETEDDNERSDEEILSEESNENDFPQKSSKPNMSSDTDSSEKSVNAAATEASARPDPSYVPKPKCKKTAEEKLLEPSNDSEEILLRSKNKQNAQEMSPKPKNKRNIEDKSTPVKPKKSLEVDESASPSKGKSKLAKKEVAGSNKKTERKEVASPCKKKVHSSPNKRKIDKEASKDSKHGPTVKKKKIAGDHPKAKLPVFKVKKTKLAGNVKGYAKKQSKIDLAAYAVKHGIEASQKYALTKYGVKVRPTSIKKLIALYPALAMLKKKQLSNNPSYPIKRPIGRPRKHPLIINEPAKGSRNVTDEADASSLIQGNHDSSSKNELYPCGIKLLHFNVGGIFGKRFKSADNSPS